MQETQTLDSPNLHSRGRQDGRDRLDGEEIRTLDPQTPNKKRESGRDLEFAYSERDLYLRTFSMQRPGILCHRPAAAR